MKIWLDTANLDEIREAAAWGVLRGVSTNPTHVANAGVTDLREHIVKIIDIIQGPVSAEVISLDWESMVREAEEIASWSPHVVVTIPATIEGLKAIHVAKGFATISATLVFSPNQAYMVAAAGAHYVSPFVQRLDAIGQNGVQVVRDTVKIFKNYLWSNEVIATSIRSPLQVYECLLAGAPIVAMPYAILRGLMDHPMTDIGLQLFLEDWARVAPPAQDSVPE